MRDGTLCSNILQLCKEIGVVRGKRAEFEYGGGGRGDEKHGKRFAEATPDGGASGVVEDSGACSEGCGGESGQVTLVTSEDFGGAGEGGAELPALGMKPVADRWQQILIRAAILASEYGGLGRCRGLLGKDLCQAGTDDIDC